MYVWFDWEDNTTSVNSINVIKEPRKPLMEYQPGDEVSAKLPKYGLWKGVILEISGKTQLCLCLFVIYYYKHVISKKVTPMLLQCCQY